MKRRTKIGIAILSILTPALWWFELVGLDWWDKTFNPNIVQVFLVGVAAMLICVIGLMFVLEDVLKPSQNPGRKTGDFQSRKSGEK